MSDLNNSIGKLSSRLPIGLRNNNPLNIRVSSNSWQGKISSDNAFEKFSSIDYGLRAAVKNIQTYYKRDKLTTIKQIVSKWAPRNENNTDSYINSVSSIMGVSSTSPLSYSSETFSKLVSAMSSIELGSNYTISPSKVKAVIDHFKLF